MKTATYYLKPFSIANVCEMGFIVKKISRTNLYTRVNFCNLIKSFKVCFIYMCICTENLFILNFWIKSLITFVSFSPNYKFFISICYQNTKKTKIRTFFKKKKNPHTQSTPKLKRKKYAPLLLKTFSIRQMGLLGAV